MRESFTGAEGWYEQERIDDERRAERDAEREPTRRSRGLTARQAAIRSRIADACVAMAGVLQPPVKLCAEGVDHEAAKTSPAWESLEYVGHQPTYDDDGSELEMRNCACHSTLCKLVPGGAR